MFQNESTAMGVNIYRGVLHVYITVLMPPPFLSSQDSCSTPGMRPPICVVLVYIVLQLVVTAASVAGE